MHLTGLFIHPVKSLRACAVAATEVDALGFVGDRRFLVVEEHGRPLTQRALPCMARIAASLSDDLLTLSAEGAGTMSVLRATDPEAPLRTVSVWKSEGLQAEDCGDDAANWLGDFLGVKCRLVRSGPAFQRPILKPEVARPGDIVNFADSDPFLIISEASLEDLNGRLVAQGHAALLMNRFRPNLVVTGCPAFAEDSWTRIKVGGMIFRASGPCSRCIMTTTDQFTGERGKEPLRLLATYRRDADNPTDVNFGQNLIHETKAGSLRVGDAVEILA
jgi:uncharacterized protein YcbX